MSASAPPTTVPEVDGPSSEAPAAVAAAGTPAATALSRRSWRVVEGAPAPLGATWLAEEQAYNFAVDARDATAVTLLLYSADDVEHPLDEYSLDPLRNKSSRVWHCRLRGAETEGAAYYAYRVDGPNAPELGHRFDREKVLLDPYAPAVFFPPRFSRAAARQPGPTAGRTPLGILPAGRPPFDWGADRPVRHEADAVIYELHVRGFTRRPSSGVGEAARGTFAGVVEKIPYLKDLGVTVVELMPVFQFDPQEGNYWGYMPLHFFSPHSQYAKQGVPGAALGEFRAMVKALHAADIEVILDVVYNHTTELDENGPTYSFRGIDNGTYYLLERGDLRRYRNDAGTGNVLRTAHPTVRRLVLDSLRFWVREMHVDGFRFDLASIFTRRDDGTIDVTDPPIIAAISSDPDFANMRLIAEAWDVSSYQLGRAFPGKGWLQWNGQFRDDARSFLKSDRGTVHRIMARLYGSDDLFPDRLPDVYRPYQSVNFVTAHDGFCLRDLVSYNGKHNEANGHGNTDGTDDNRSWNCGWEGDEGAPAAVEALRRRQVKNFCAVLMLANGTPMVLAGDEFMHSQRGNNNPYNQDDETTWLDWDRLRANADVFRFFREMIALRKAHPTLCRSRYWREDVRWYGVGPSPDLSPDSHTIAYFVAGASEGDDDFYVMINAYWEPLRFQVQEGAGGQWRRVVDTARASPDDIVAGGGEALATLLYDVQPRSVVVLIRGSS